MRKEISTVITCLFLATLQLSPQTAKAQAYCALRDPVKSIYSLFPDATSYRSSVKKIESNALGEFNDELKLFLHRNELGDHTLYVVYEKEKPMGFVHVRSEQSTWGLVEIAWALDISAKRIIDFSFQRCREPFCRSRRKVEALKKQILQKSEEELASILNTKLAGQDDEQSSPLLTCVRSALKTLKVTQVVWQEEVLPQTLPPEENKN